MSLSITPTVLPTGGACGLSFTTAVSGDISLERSPYPGTPVYTQLYSGTPLNPRGEPQFFLDLGDQTPAPLQPTTQYIYQLTDVTGTIVSDPITPVASINLDRTDWDSIFISLLQGAIDVVQLPKGINRCRVVYAMPLNGLQPMPFIVVNNDLLQQEEVPLGQANPTLGEGFLQPPYSKIWTQTGLDKHIYRISILSTSATERSFYRDLIIATFRANLYYIFQQVGNDITHSYQAASYQSTASHDGMLPGFYGADVMLEFTGTNNVSIVTSYGIVEEIISTTIVSPYDDSPDTAEVVTQNPNEGSRAFIVGTSDVGGPDVLC
jgi:hypothetical protein